MVSEVRAVLVGLSVLFRMSIGDDALCMLLRFDLSVGDLAVRLGSSCDFLTWLLVVVLDIERTEEVEEERRVDTEQEGQEFREVAVRHQNLWRTMQWKSDLGYFKDELLGLLWSFNNCQYAWYMSMIEMSRY